MTKTIREIRHKLVDLKEEVNAERLEKIQDAKLKYLENKNVLADDYKAVVAEIKANYRDIYKERKAELITEVQED